MDANRCYYHVSFFLFLSFLPRLTSKSFDSDFMLFKLFRGGLGGALVYDVFLYVGEDSWVNSSWGSKISDEKV